MKTQSGFTLVEVIVTVIITAIFGFIVATLMISITAFMGKEISEKKLLTDYGIIKAIMKNEIIRAKNVNSLSAQQIDFNNTNGENVIIGLSGNSIIMQKTPGGTTLVSQYEEGLEIEDLAFSAIPDTATLTAVNVFVAERTVPVVIRSTNSFIIQLRSG